MRTGGPWEIPVQWTIGRMDEWMDVVRRSQGCQGESGLWGETEADEVSLPSDRFTVRMTVQVPGAFKRHGFPDASLAWEPAGRAVSCSSEYYVV